MRCSTTWLEMSCRLEACLLGWLMTFSVYLSIIIERRIIIAADPPTTPEHKLCCSPSAATYTDIGLLNARDCIVQHYKGHSIELTRTATATQLRSCTDADADGHVTRSEIVRMATDCGIFPESPPASTVTLESRRDMFRC